MDQLPVMHLAGTLLSFQSAAGTPKKKYYLACGNCHWTTRDAGYEDKELSGRANKLKYPFTSLSITFGN